jgi:diguanylate cyclase (GGDEF)-like protein/PAS domain S-box-containing protein
VKKKKLLSTPITPCLLFVPALVSIFIYFFYLPISANDFIKNDFGWALLAKSNGFIWDNFYRIYALTYTFVCIFLIYEWGRNSKFKREKRQSHIFIITIIIAILFGSFTEIVLPALDIYILPPSTVLFIAIPMCAVWYSIKRYRLMNLSPQNVVFDVIQGMQEGLVITDEKERIKYVNNGTLELLGYSLEELNNKPISLIVDDAELRKYYTENSNELLLNKKNNENIPVLFTSSIIKDDWDEPFGSVHIFQDLTEINNIQQEVKKSRDELEIKVIERTKELDMINRELRQEIQSRIKMEEKISKLAYFDDLTGLFNKKSFTEYVDKKISENLRNELSLAIMYVDLDSFKLVNDTLGYQLGDKIIIQAAQRLTENLRISDTTARVGADEFLVLLQNNPDEDTIHIIAEKVNEAFRREFLIEGNDVHITASIGVAVYPLDGNDADTLIKNANIAMHRAKEKGKNKYEICNPTMKENLIETMMLTNQLYRAVADNEFELYYQPQVDTCNGNIVGFESLIRWQHPELGIVPPNRFIPIAEKTGLIIQIGEWVIEQACKQMKIWQDSNIVLAPISVNLSAKQFVDYDLIGKVSEVINSTGIEPKYLEFEITESVLMEDIVSISHTLKELSKLGVRIAIDDFGTKYSSLNYLKQLPINKLKIDMSFVQGINVNHKDEIIINTIIALAKKLKMSVLAEGVESFRQMNFLKKADCHIVQGYYLYRPMPPTKIENLFNVS